MVKGIFRHSSRRNFYWGAKSGPKSQKKNLPKKKSHEAHQIDQQNVPNSKMYVVRVKNDYFVFQGPKGVGID